MPARALEAERASRPVRTGRPQPMRPADRIRAAEARAARSRPVFDSDAVEYPRSADRRPQGSRPVARGSERGRIDDRDDRRPSARPAARPAAASRPRPSESESRIRGVVAVLAMFLVTLAGAGIDSFVGIGLGLVTLGTLVTITAIAAWVVRRRDLVSVLVAPPLVFVAVAGLNIALAPSASFNLPTVATLLVRGFPTMAMATGVALVLALVRLAARR
jgi:hypothetical protein